MRLFVSALLLLSISACSEQKPDSVLKGKSSENAADQIDTVSRHDADISKKPNYSFNESRQYGDYDVTVTQDKSSHEMTLTVKRDSILVWEESQEVNDVDRVVVRDLDSDGLLEVYVVSIGGNAMFETIYMHEIEGGELDQGDLRILYGAHDYYFTEDKLVHKHWLESDKGCCDYLGLEFTYFELVDNRFTLIKFKNWMHRDGEPVNASRNILDRKS